MTRIAACALVVAAACGPAATTAATASPAASPTHHVATATATPINVDDMMGGSLAPATVFAHVGDQVVAVKLQNHFVPYRVPVGGRPHVAAAADGSRVYVADRKDGRTRVRALDPATGVEMTAASLFDEPPAGTSALAQDRADRLLLLVEACPTCSWGEGVRIEAVSTSPLAARGAIYKAPCGDHLLASSARLAIVCSSAGTVSIGQIAAGGTVEGPQGGGLTTATGGPIVASAMLPDGTIVIGTADGLVRRIPAGSASFVPVAQMVPGSVLADGIAAAGSDRFVALTTAGDGARAAAYVGSTGQLAAGPFPLRSDAAGLAALWPFAYFGGVHGLYHVELLSGLLERMVELDRPNVLAVAAR